MISGHPYNTGLGLGGEPLGFLDFDSWQPTDFGTLANLPAGATIVLSNSHGPSWAEYRYGAGRVIVATLTYCWDGKPNSQGAAARNLFRYGRSEVAPVLPSLRSQFVMDRADDAPHDDVKCDVNEGITGTFQFDTVAGAHVQLDPFKTGDVDSGVSARPGVPTHYEVRTRHR